VGDSGLRLVLIIAFFMLPWINWGEPLPPPPAGGLNASAGAPAGNPVSAVDLATKGGLYALWLVPLSALVILLATYLESRSVGHPNSANANIVVGAGLVVAVTLLFSYITMSGTHARSHLQFIRGPISFIEGGSGDYLAVGAVVFIIIAGSGSGVRQGLQRSGGQTCSEGLRLFAGGADIDS